ncbi:unnamed protein product [marine sediment metagenome]|uniref:Uncharacterized protein n=1 Tax=marine sediment metagenome TaxID=412755 RepID=X0Y733_9ZZZZ
MYELRNILRNKSEIALVYSDYKYIDQLRFEKVVNAEKIFSKKNNLGYCFLARKEVISESSDYKISIFNEDVLYLYLKKNNLLHHTLQILGIRYYKAGIFTLILHILNKLMDIKRREGWRVVAVKSINFFRKFLITKIKKGWGGIFYISIPKKSGLK